MLDVGKDTNNFNMFQIIRRFFVFDMPLGQTDHPLEAHWESPSSGLGLGEIILTVEMYALKLGQVILSARWHESLLME